MGFRYRRSIQVMPGVRLNVSKSGIGYSVGARGMRVTHSATGRTYRTLSIPGTGISHVQTLGTSRRPSTGATTPVPSPPAKPGLFAPTAEKELYKAVHHPGPGLTAFAPVGRAHADVRVLAAALEGFGQLQAGNQARARELLAWVYAQGEEVATHPFTRKYLAGAAVTIPIADGVTATLPLCRAAVGLAATELHQAAGDLDVAIATVELIDPPTTLAAVSLAELYLAAGRYADVVDVTDQVTNADDPTALLCVFRAAALREQGFFDAAREALKEALRFRSRAAEIRHRAYIERAVTYLAQRKFALARKDLERVLAEDSDAPGLAEALTQLPR